jgi:heptosyltransferase-2
MKTIKKIALILPNYFGDSINVIPALDLLRKQHPSAVIYALGLACNTELLSRFEGVQALPLPIKHSKFKRSLLFYQQLRSIAPDACIITSSKFKDAFVAWLARVPKRVGYRNRLRSGLLTHKIKRNPNRHYINHYAYLADLLSAQPSQHIGRTWLPPVHANVDRWLQSPKGQRLGFVFGSKHKATRFYPNHHSLALMQLVHQTWPQMHAYILGTAEEGEACAQWHDPKTMPWVHNLAGKTNLPEVEALIDAMDLIVSIDTSLLHLAGALNKPIVALHSIGSSPFSSICPQGKNLIVVESERHFLYDEHQALDLKPQAILEAIQIQLKSKPSPEKTEVHLQQDKVEV